MQNIWSQEALDKYNLMPWPKEIEDNTAKFMIDSNVTISIMGENHPRVRNAAINFLRRLANRTGVFIDNGFPLKEVSASIEINYNTISNLTVNDDESYTLVVKEDKVIIDAISDVGALRGMETLLQLVSYNEDNYFFQGVTIKDAPRFVWRGLMIDVARHFQPVDVLKRNLDAMASVKLNVFHWHLTDDQGFRVESKVYPRLQEIAADGLFYTQEQIRDVVAYASNLGIRVIPEFDVPGHASAILAAYPELGSKDDYDYKVERFAGVFDPTLDPSKKITYLFLETLFREIAPLFPDEYFHIGGDENEGKHWNENAEIQEFKKKHNLKTNHDLQTYFNIRLEKILKKLGKKLMGWDEILTPSIPTTAVIHSWRGEHEGLEQSTLIEAAQKGYQAVLSAGYYIDRMLSVEHHYLVDPIGDAVLSKEERKRILGAEATMWSELVTPLTIDSRIWPRTAAIAERYWSPKNTNDLIHMRKRLKVINYQLEELGINHIRNKDVILRNISKNEDTKPLRILSKICEPLKIYSRNKGGTEYKSFSPFTLFADACTADAEDAIEFNNVVSLFIKNDNKENLNAVNNFLTLWAENHIDFIKINNNPNTQLLEPLSKNLSNTSKLFLTILSNKKITLTEFNNLKALLTNLEEPFMDTELAILSSLKNLLTYCKANYLIQ
ncbi:riboflavin synthase subunit alpha [Flavobacteriales bacterium ALC-1]|nr:riboflavin synthase subunit alpha [Flavobacteriales bacterium ALC-1]